MDDASSAFLRPSRARRCLALGLHGALSAALIPAVLWVAPTAVTAAPATVAVLMALSIISDRHDVPLPTGIRFDALIALALISLVLAGPAATLLVVYAPMAFNALTGRQPLARAGNLANLAAYAAYTLTGAYALDALPVTPTDGAALPWLALIGLLLLVVNWLIGPAVYGPLWLGRPIGALLRMLFDAIPPATAMLVLGAATVALTPVIGDAALVAFALVAVLPQSALTFAARTRPVARLDRVQATRAYAAGLALQLRLSRPARRHLLAVASRLAQQPTSRDPLDYALATLRHPGDEIGADAHLVHEHWDGSGRPIGLRHEMIPLSSRVLAVAEAWSALTARGTAERSHGDALAQLQARAGQALDPIVVRAAHDVVAQEPVSAAEPAPEPRLHALRLPAPLRRFIAAHACETT